MVFNRKEGFFLDLGSEGTQPAKVAIKAPPAAATKPAATATKAPATATKAPAASPATKAEGSAEAAPSSAPSPAASTGVLTTAEAIAAELRAAQEALPPPNLATFAPDNLNPANAIPTRRRRAGANLAGFKGIARSLFGN